MSVIINPGSGPVPDATSIQALANARVFAREVDAKVEGPLGTDGDGRWEFRLLRDNRAVEIEMPGIPLDKVRYIDSADQDIWNFPRLYVDGSSWVWLYALNAARSVLGGEDEDRDG